MSVDHGRLEALFRARFDNAQMAQVLLGPTGLVEQVNAAFCAFLGVRPADIVGRPAGVLRHESDTGVADGLLRAVLTGEQPAGQAERIMRHASGTAIPTLITVAAVLEDDASILGASVFMQDLRMLRDIHRRLEQQEQFFYTLGQRANDAAVVIAPDGHLVYVSPAVIALFGYAPTELQSLNSGGFVHPEDAMALTEAFERVVADGGTQAVEGRIRAADGSWRWVENTLTNLIHSPVGGVVSQIVDVTARKASEDALALAQARTRAVLDATQEGIWVVTPEGRTDFVNPRMADILGMAPDELYARSPVTVLGGEDPLRLDNALHERALNDPDDIEVRYAHPDGTHRHLRVVAAPLPFDDGVFRGSVAMVSDVTHAKHMASELRRAALRDSLTGLPNRTLLSDRIEQRQLRLAAKHSGVMALLFVDLDQFKLVNDARGHNVGDEVLVEVARRLRALIPPQDTVARLGADEFIILTTGEDSSAADALAEKVVAAVAEPIVTRGQTVHVTASVGVATSPPVPPEDLLRYADTAMFAAKSGGRAHHRTFDQSLALEAETTGALSGDLWDALHDDTLDMHYQPILDLAGGQIVGFEALARWTHPSRGAIPPTLFVPLAERTGLAHELNGWAVSRALADLGRMHRAQAIAVGAYVAVNVSVLHLHHPDLEQRLLAAVTREGLTPAHVAIEITESALMQNTDAVSRTLSRLRDVGFRVAIDDFGTGYSSLAYLRDLPIDAVKIDRSFVSCLAGDPGAQAIVSSVVQMATTIGLDTVAEGVETPEQASLLRGLGCRHAQGWLWSRAVPAAALPDLPVRFALPDDGRPAPGGRPEDRTGQRLRELRREGATLSAIASTLNADGYPAPSGGTWHSISVARALSAVRDHGSLGNVGT